MRIPGLLTLACATLASDSRVDTGPGRGVVCAQSRAPLRSGETDRQKFTLLFLAVVFSGIAFPVRGIESARQKLLADFGWRFVSGDPTNAESVAFDDSVWRPVDLPHDWSIEGPYDPWTCAHGRPRGIPADRDWVVSPAFRRPGRRGATEKSRLNSKAFTGAVMSGSTAIIY